MRWSEAASLVASVAAAVAQVASLALQVREGRQAAAAGTGDAITYVDIVQVVVSRGSPVPSWDRSPRGQLVVRFLVPRVLPALRR